MKKHSDNIPRQAWIRSTGDLGRYLRAYRKARGINLETAAGLSNVSIKFLSEFERGKETAEIGKVLKVLNAVGLKLIIEQRYKGTPRFELKE